MSEKHKILIADDEPFVREALEALLFSEGYDLVFAENGQEALEKAAELTPDLILLDVMMPDMDGFKVCRHLRANQHLAEVPIIIVTALDDRDSRLEGIEAGADDFITKPFDRHELRLRIRTITRLNRYRNLLEERIEKENLENRLSQAQKMEAIGTLAAGIAHDFNNILFPILCYTEISIDSLPEESDIRGNLEEVVIATERAKKLVDQILTFSRQDKLQKIPLEIRFVVKEAVKLMLSSVPPSVTVSEFIDKNCGTVLADPTQIHQVVMNLCTNAWHAMSDKGGELKVGLTAENENMKLTVSDTGEGIDKATLERIFDPYFTTKKVGGGTGMGLSVVHGIIESHNGKITVDSTVGKGTVFSVYLPLITSESAVSETISGEILSGGSERILLVDDDEQINIMLQKTLENYGYHVTAHKSSPEALHVFDSGPENFDLVVTNHSMPYMTGIRLSEEIMKIRSGIPIILCTGFGDSDIKEKAEKMGIDNFLMKPVPNKQLLNTIRKVLDEADSC
ncbi:response regulator [Desulfococcaceae bacterium HSG8]|nr:response regulator [Desulfococcaceae bacterium HSG8]